MDVHRSHLPTIEGKFTCLRTETAHQTEFLEANHFEIHGIAESILDVLSFYRNYTPRQEPHTYTNTHIYIHIYAQQTVNGHLILCGLCCILLTEVNLNFLRNRMCHEASLILGCCSFLGLVRVKMLFKTQGDRDLTSPNNGGCSSQFVCCLASSYSNWMLAN